MKLYGSIASPYVARTVMFARIKGIDLPLESPLGGGTRTPEYLAIGKMPSLDIDGNCIAESEVICEYLEDTHQGKPGLPQDPVHRARSRLVSRIVDLYLAPAIGPLFRNMNPAKRDTAAVESAAAELAKGVGYLEHFMGPGPFVVADKPTLGDCALGPYTVLLKKAVFANFPNIPDFTNGNGRLATWWKAVQGDANCGVVIREYSEAVDAFMKAMAARSQ